MASRYEVELTIGSARDLKNVNWRHGDLKPYAVAWVDPASKCSTKVDVDGGTDPTWDEKISVPLGRERSIDDAVLHIDIVHAGAASADDVKPLVGSTRLQIREIVEEAGIGGKISRSLKLKRPSGRPHGRIDVKIAVKDHSQRYGGYDSYAPPYGSGYAGSRDYPGAYGGGGYAQPYAAAPPSASGYPYGGAATGYGAAPPPASGYGAPPPAAGYGPPPSAAGYGPPPPAAGYGPPPPASGYGGYGAAPPPASGYGYPQSTGYGQAPPPTSSYGQFGYDPAAASVPAQKSKSKFGMGTGLAVGAVGGVLGGLALAEGFDFLENKIADDAADKVERDDDYRRDDNYGGDYYDDNY